MAQHILFVTKVVPGSSMTGQGHRITAQYRALMALGALDSVLIGNQPLPPSAWPRDYGSLVAGLPEPDYPRNLGVFWKRGGNRLWPAIFAATPFLSLRTIYRPTVATAESFAALARSYDLIFISYLQHAWALGWRDAQRTVIDLDDVPSQRFTPPGGPASAPQRLLRRWRWWRARRCEHQALGDYRLTLVCSEQDARYLHRYPRVAVLPNCVLDDPAMGAADDPTPAAGRMLFVGALAETGFNIDGLTWFVQQVLPLVRREVSNAHVQVVGQTSPNLSVPWRHEPGVAFVGTVDRVAPYIQGCQFQVCPLLGGFGTRVKTIESLLFARPVVATTIGAYGLAMDEARGILRRDDPPSFARACVDLLRDPERCRTLGLAGRAEARRLYSLEAFTRRLQELVRPILG